MNVDIFYTVLRAGKDKLNNILKYINLSVLARYMLLYRYRAARLWWQLT